MKTQHKQVKKFNRYTMWAEIIAGTATACAVSPLNVVFDKSVMIFSKFKGNLFGIAGTELANIFKHPMAFLGDFGYRWMLFVYIPTFSVNNLFDNYNLARLFDKPEQSFIQHKYQKLAVVFLTSALCSLIKDKKYAEKYANKLPKFPLSSYLLLFSRDLIAMAGAFTLPPILATYLTTKFDITKSHAQRIAQLSCPLLIQFVGTPIHLMALDINNEPVSTMSQRVSRVKALYPASLGLRILRFLPAYGIGGIVNIELRKYLKQKAPVVE